MKNLLNKKTYTTQTYENRYEIVKELIGKFQEQDYNYSKHFMNNSYFARNYKSDIRKLELFLYKNGYDLKKFMKDYKPKIYEDDFFISNSGFMDSLLYMYDSDFPLSGGNLQDYGQDEFIIKYFYDYDKYDLGKKYLLQYYDNVKEFYHDCAKTFLNKDKNEAYDVLNFTEDFDKIKDNFSKIIEVPRGYLCVIKINKYFKYRDDGEFENVKEFVDYLEGEFLQLKRSQERFNYSFVESKLIVVAFGDNMYLDGIGLDSNEYGNIIDINYSTKKYNL